MSKVVITITPNRSKLSRKEAEYVQTLVKRAKDLIFYNDEFGRPERKKDILGILWCFVEQNTPPNSQRNIAKQVDEYLAPMLEHGMPREKALPIARKIAAELSHKPVGAVKAAHVRYGTVGVTKKARQA